jgi:hypothetical protein
MVRITRQWLLNRFQFRPDDPEPITQIDRHIVAKFPTTPKLLERLGCAAFVADNAGYSSA